MRSALLAVAALAAACSSPPAARPPAPGPGPGPAAPAAPPSAAGPPRLVVLLIIDQLPQWAFAQKRPHLTGGFDRLLREGAWHIGEHPSAATITAPGHAVISTGEPPAWSGIPSNEWYRREHDRIRHSVEAPDGGISAHQLRVPGIADAIAAAGTGAKAVAISLKERAAILSLGQAGLPIWYDRKAVAWTSTGPVPPWLAEHNRRAPIAARLKDRWVPADPQQLAAISGTTDDQPGEVGTKGLGTTFPHDLAATKDPGAALIAVPAGNGVVLEAGLAAIDGEGLGRDDTPDLLALSLSAYDYAGHAWGQESWEVWDMTLRLDAQLGRFLDALDARVGAGRWAMLVTSDHGASPLPERVGGGRLTYESIHDSANRAATTALGLGEWIADVKFPSVYLSAAARARAPRDQQRAIAKIVSALRAFPGLAHVGRTAAFAGRCEARTGDALLICLALDPDQSGEIFYLPARGWLVQERADPLATSHGSLHPYDREVPLILAAPGRTPHPPLAAPADPKIPIVQVPGILARWLGVTAPSALPR
jgi:hypothetical protein